MVHDNAAFYELGFRKCEAEWQRIDLAQRKGSDVILCISISGVMRVLYEGMGDQSKGVG